MIYHYDLWKMVLGLMYVVARGTFGVEIGSVRFLILDCLTICTLLRILALNCLDAMLWMNKKSVVHAYDETDECIRADSCSGESLFSPLVFSASGSMGPSTTTVYSKLASGMECN